MIWRHLPRLRQRRNAAKPSSLQPWRSALTHVMTPNRLFLDVERSVLGRPWRDRLDLVGQGRAQAITQLQGRSDILARVLAGRGVAPDDVETFLDPTLRKLMPDPDTLRDMSAAVDRLARAIRTGEMVAIFGDYDVDGACASALLAGFMRACGTPFLVHIPDRIFEGYGPNSEAIRTLAGQGATLLVTVDCGTTSFEPFADAQSLGVDVVVLDHHQAPIALPPVAAIVNPNRQDDLSGLGALCATGVTYMALVALNRRLREMGFWTATRPAPDLLAALDIVALATVADVVPLTGLNRAFVSKGLAVMRARGRPGLRALIDVSGADGPPRPYHLGFLLGPRINAGGRIGDAALGSKLLLMEDEAEATRVAVEPDRLNRERQAIEFTATGEAEAEALASLGLADDGSAIVTASDAWHPGIVGLVAARLKERFSRPAFAIHFNGATGTGSGRSIPGVDLGKIVRAAVEADILIKGGGHAMAAGVTIARARLGDFRAFLAERMAAALSQARAEDALFIDAALTAGGARPELVHDIDQAGPFGSGNPEPVFALPAHRIVDAAQVGTGHIRVVARSGDDRTLSAIAFRAASGPLGAALLKARGGTLHLAGTLSIDRWGGGERVQMRLLDAAEPGSARRL
jgi:single-stranded-DNA-specific exonuclease